MTEKRFWLVPLDYYGEQRFVRDNNMIGEKSISNGEVVDLLNKFQELSINDLKRIEELEKENNHLKYKLGDRDEAFEVFACEVYEKIFEKINERITLYNTHLEEQNEIIMGNAFAERLGTLKELKEALEVQAGLKHYCTDCESLQYHGDFEDMDCGNVHAIPEHGAPEIISSEVNTCPFFKQRGVDVE